jgi:hypothetical protein
VNRTVEILNLSCWWEELASFLGTRQCVLDVIDSMVRDANDGAHRRTLCEIAGAEVVHNLTDIVGTQAQRQSNLFVATLLEIALTSTPLVI